MTLRFIAVLFICTPVIAQAQEPRVNEVFFKVSMPKVLKTIQENYHVKIAYDPALVKNIVVALELRDMTPTESLERLFTNTPLTFQKVGDNFVIVPRPRQQESVGGKVNLSLSGRVVDADTEETLPQATITVRGVDRVTTTNNDGHFTVFDIPSDTCSLEIRYLGYFTQIIRVSNIDHQHPVDIKLQSDTKVLDEVVVLDEYNQAVHIEPLPGTLVFNPASLSTLPSLGEQDISRTLQLTPGVSATDESSSGLSIRGSHPSYNLTLLDGMTIYQQDHFFGAFSIINADIVKDVHLEKGMFDARYGGRVSGVIDITTKNGNAVKPAFNAKLNLINGKSTIELPISKKWSLFAGVRRSFTDIIRTDLFTNLFDIARVSNDQIEIFRVVEGLGLPVTPRYYFFDTNAKLTFRPSFRDVMSLSFYMSRDKMRIADSTSFSTDFDKFIMERDETTRWGNNGASFRWGRQWSEQYYSSARISDSKFFRKFDYYQDITLDTISSAYFLGFENSITDLSYAIDNEWTPGNNLSFSWGIAGTRQRTYANIRDQYTISGDIPPDETIVDTTQYQNSWLHGVYGSITVSPIKKLTTTAGVRLVRYYNQQGQSYAEPRFTTQYKPVEQLSLKAGYARSNQFITQLFYYSPTGLISGINENFWMLSRPDDTRYPVISSDHVSAGATLKGNQIVYDSEVYYKTARGVIIDEDLNSGRVNTYGLDVMIQKISGIHKGWIAYSLSHSTQAHPAILNGQRVPSWQDQRHEFKIADMLMLGNWNISSTLVYGSGKPYARYEVIYVRDQDGMINDYDLALDYRNKSRLPAYFRIDLGASYSVQLKNSTEIQIGFSIHNVTDRKNIKTRRIDTSGPDEALFGNIELPATYNDIVLLGISPSLSVGVSF